MLAMKRKRLCQLPSAGSISGRSSSITNAFFNAIIPIIKPTEDEELEALRVLGINPDDICCAYCGDRATEWDHLHPIIRNQEPTGYITEIANLVPSCGKCNQSKGKAEWRFWMRSGARLSPSTRTVSDIERRISRLEDYEKQFAARTIDFAAIVDDSLWTRHKENWRRVLEMLKESQKLAAEIRVIVAKAGSEAISPKISDAYAIPVAD
jgi:hypothetical protein